MTGYRFGNVAGWYTSRTCGRSSRSSPSPGRRPGSAPARPWRCRRGGRGPARRAALWGRYHGSGRRAVRRRRRPRRRRRAVHVPEPRPTLQARRRPARAVGTRSRRDRRRTERRRGWVDRQQRRLGARITSGGVRARPGHGGRPRTRTADDRRRRRTQPTARPATNASRSSSADWSSSTAGSRTACAPGSPIPAAPASPPGTRWPAGSPMPAPGRSPTAYAGSPAESVPSPTGTSTVPRWASSTCWPGRSAPAAAQRARRRRAVACGWQVRKADVESSAPDTDRWLVVGRSDTRGPGRGSPRVAAGGARAWAMVLSFAAYRQALDSTLVVGTIVDADLHRYPGSAQRASWGPCTMSTKAPRRSAAAIGGGVDAAGACELVGAVLASEPWLERVPAIVRRRSPAATASGCSPTTRVRPSPRVGARRWSPRCSPHRAGSRRPSPSSGPSRRRAAHRVPRRPDHRHRPPRRSQLRERGVMSEPRRDVERARHRRAARHRPSGPT